MMGIIADFKEFKRFFIKSSVSNYMTANWLYLIKWTNSETYNLSRLNHEKDKILNRSKRLN